MTNFVATINACEQASGAGTKNLIKDALSKADTVAQRLIKEALNPYRVFGVRKYEMPPPAQATDATAYDNFFSLLDSLASRELTGNAARDAVTATLSLFANSDQQMLVRVFDKDLKCGFSAETFNKIYPSNAIPVFNVMLADKCESVEEFENEISFPCQADFKYDGIRTIAFVKNNEVIYYNRSGKLEQTVNGTFDSDLQKIRSYLGYDFVLDGERYASNFTETLNAKKSGNDSAKNALKFRAFFLMPMSDWESQSTDITMKMARTNLEKILNACQCEKVILTEGKEVSNYAEMMKFCNDAIDIFKVEGLILKDWNSVYIWDRKIAWCKVKRFYDADCRIIGFYPGRPKSRLANTLGGIIVEGTLEDGTYVHVNVGSGFSDDLRNEIWNNQDKWLNCTAVITYQEVSKSKGKEHASLRFPTYSHCRDDKEVFTFKD